MSASRRVSPLSVPDANPQHCTPGVRLAMLAKVPLFAGLTGEELAEVDDRCRSLGFIAGEAIYLEGDPATRILVVATGAVKTIRPTIDGRETLLDLCGPGDFFGAVPALGEQTYPDSAWAVSGSCLLALSAEDYDAVMERFPSVAMATLKGVSRRLVAAQQAVHLLAGAPLEQRLAAVLLLLADKLGRRWEGAVLIDVPLGRDDLASMVGAATESVSRLLSGWRREGMIESGRRWVAVRDVAGLTALRDL